MLRWMAPFLSFTAEEAWKVLGPGDRRRSSSRPSGRCRRAAGRRRRCCARRWQRIREIRDAVNQAIESAAHRRRRRLFAAGRDRRSRTGADRARCCIARRRPAVRARSRRRRASQSADATAEVPSTPSSARQVRALLALPRRRRPRRRAPDDLRRAAPSNLYGAGEARTSPDGAAANRSRAGAVARPGAA